MTEGEIAKTFLHRPAAVMAVLVCGCGASDSGDEENAGAGGAVPLDRRYGESGFSL